MPDRDQDLKDIGRCINLILRRMGRTELLTPEATVERYVTSSLDAFKSDNTDIFNIELRGLEGIPTFQLIPGGRIRAGGTGIVIQVQNPTTKVFYALKFVRPTFIDKPEYRDPLSRVAKREFLRHAPLSHNNVARILGTAELQEQREGMDHQFWVLMMEWLEGATPLCDYIRDICEKPSPTLYSEIISLLSQCFSALAYIHSHEIIHWDIKSDNFLVSNNVPKLTDFGNARILTDGDRGPIAFTTEGNFPPGLDDCVLPPDDTGSSNRARILLPDTDAWDCPWLDLWMLSREVMTLFRRESEPYSVSHIYQNGSSADARDGIVDAINSANYDRNEYLLDCLRTILRRILVARAPEENRYYQNASQVVSDLMKLDPEFGASQNVSELWAIPQKMLRLPVSGNVPLPTRIRKILDTPPIDRLSHHLQLGGVYQVYRGGNHTRTEHVAGVLAATCDYVRALFADQSNVFWRLNIERRDIEILLFTALVHDIGHIAFGHFIEEMEGLVGERKHENYLLAVLDPSRFTAPWASSEDIHADREVLMERIQKDWGATTRIEAEAFLRDSSRILSPSPSDRAFSKEDIYDKKLCDETKMYILHSILDSAIDADKLDYLFRDAHHCGVPYAFAIDYDRFFQSLTTIPDFSLLNKPASDKRRPCIGVSTKGIQPLESILIARYQMFVAVYWQHTARAQTCMLQFLITEFLSLSMSPPQEGKQADGLSRYVDKLFHEFRTQSDEAAINWIVKKLAKSPIGSSDAARLRRICDCLTNVQTRVHLYRAVFTLTYEREQEQEISKIYSSLKKEWEETNEVDDPATYLKKVREQRQRITQLLSEKLNFSLDYGEVLIDIPPANKDQVDDVYVDYGDGIKPFYDVSPLGAAVSDIFANWTRSVRIFLDPDALGRILNSEKSRSDIEDACLAVLKEFQSEERRK